MLKALARAIPNSHITREYQGSALWFVVYGYGHPVRNQFRQRHLRSGRPVVIWDLAYFDRERSLRCSINHDHPQHWLDQTPADPSRWDRLEVKLREDCYDPNGHIILVGLGRKSRSYLNVGDWENAMLRDLRLRFPDKKIIYRPKPKSPAMRLDCATDSTSKFEHLLRGASLVFCRHSNAACDAAIAGVPFECIDGAARWLVGRPYTPENRLGFLRRLAWWEWRADEAGKAWEFLQSMDPEKMTLQ